MREYLQKILTSVHREDNEEVLGIGGVMSAMAAMFMPIAILPDTTSLAFGGLVYLGIASTYLVGVVAAKIGMAFIFRGADQRGGNVGYYARKAINTGAWAWHLYALYFIIAAPLLLAITTGGKAIGGSNSMMERLTESIMTTKPKQLPRSREE